jgi:predicted phage baseplate assembly protein
MPLPLPSLDRRTFAELVAEGRALIPRFAPGWTDHNVHDPGITFLELFAYLVEMDIYRLDRISESARRAFLRLLGIELCPAQLAVTEVIFSSTATATVSLPAGSQVRGATTFQTNHVLNVSPAKLTAAFTGHTSPTTDLTDANVPDGRRYQPFGAVPQPGTALFLGFDEPFAAWPVEISLYVWTGSAGDREVRNRLIAEWDAARAEVKEKCVPHWSLHYSARTRWEYRVTGGGWAALEGVTDETRALTLSGPVRFSAPPDQEPEDGRFGSDACWLPGVRVRTRNRCRRP